MSCRIFHMAQILVHDSSRLKHLESLPSLMLGSKYTSGMHQYIANLLEVLKKFFLDIVCWFRLVFRTLNLN